MPTYEYVCEKCGHAFELFQSMNDKPLKTCPAALCGEKKWGKGKVKKQIGAGAGLIFKGSGFYITDYRSDKYKEAAKKDSKDSTPAPATGGDKKTDAAAPAPATTKTSSETKPSKTPTPTPKAKD